MSGRQHCSNPAAGVRSSRKLATSLHGRQRPSHTRSIVTRTEGMEGAAQAAQVSHQTRKDSSHLGAGAWDAPGATVLRASQCSGPGCVWFAARGAQSTIRQDRLLGRRCRGTKQTRGQEKLAEGGGR